MNRLHTIADVEAQLKPYEAIKHAGPYKLDTMRALMAYLGNPQEQVRVIHVAGTSGKTSTSYYIAALLTAQGYQVGLSVSPHIESVQERTQVNMQLMDEGEYCALMEAFLALIEASDLEPSYFELMVAFSFWVFARRELDFAVMEVGLGGLLDGTNVVSRSDKVCVITDIGLDHQEILGETLGEIAAQKAGIVQAKNDVFMYEQSDEVMGSVKNTVSTSGGVLHIVDKKATDMKNGLKGFQRRNFGLAVTVVRSVVDDLSDDAIEKAAKIIVPARMQLLKMATGVPVIIDGSHNAQKIGALVTSFKEAFPNVRPVLVVSFGHNRQATMSEGLALLREISDSIIVTSFTSHQDARQQSLDTAIVANEARQLGFTDVKEIEAPLDALAAASADAEMVLVTGSFYLLRHVRPALHSQ